MEKDNEPKNSEILSAINQFADHVEDRFNKIDGRFEKVEGRLEKVEGGLNQVKSEITSVKSQMVTKDYLDEKLADLRGDLVVLVRKEDTKVKVLVETLKEKKILNDADVKKIIGMEPFAPAIL